MGRKKNNTPPYQPIDNMDKATLFREKAVKYLCCFNDHCPRHAECLRWEVGQYVDPDQHLTTCISPKYGKAQDGSCEFFRTNQLLRMPLGMTHFYHDMPGHMEVSIKRVLIGHSNRSTYYKYHSGYRPIGPAMLSDIQETCREYGWTQPLQFDREVEDYDW